MPSLSTLMFNNTLTSSQEEIKCLKAANRAASFRRRFMVYQQQEIQRLHQANLIIRERIEKDTSKKGSDSSSREVGFVKLAAEMIPQSLKIYIKTINYFFPFSTVQQSQSHPKTSSPVPKPNSQSTPSSSSKSQTNQSASAKSVSEDVSGQQGASQASPNTTGSSFPSYGTPEDGKQGQPSTNVRGEQETSTILDILRYVILLLVFSARVFHLCDWGVDDTIAVFPTAVFFQPWFFCTKRLLFADVIFADVI